MAMHSIYRRVCVLASLTILSVGAFSHSEIRSKEIPSKEANVTITFREKEMKLTNTTVHWISPTLFQIEVGDNRDACELSRIFNQELEPCSHVENKEGIRQQRGLEFTVRSARSPLSTSEPTREITIAMLVYTTAIN
jgi:hypothetical protein